MILCPECNDVITDTACKSGKQCFESKSRVLDLMPWLTDNRLIEEVEYPDRVAETGKMVINADRYMDAEMANLVQRIFLDHIITNFDVNSLTIGKIACGEGSAIMYLRDIPFKVNYYGADISLKIMQAALKRTYIPNTWKVNFFRTTADR